MSGEDSEHTSILVQERTVNTPQSWSGEDTYISGEAIPRSCVSMGEKYLDP